MSYSVTAGKLKQVYGYTLMAKSRDGADAIIRVPQQPPGWPRGGAEAYGLKTDLEVKKPNATENISAFLKIFRTEVRQRGQRTRLLIDMGLARRSEYFYGIPFGWLGRVKINGLDVIAHFTRMIPGPYNGGPEDFGRLRSDGRWKGFPRDRRYEFAGELAVAVAGLERAGIVHGDISPGNILIGHSKSGTDICILCDYDGYHHAQVARLPRKDGKMPCRPLGSPGYQYPDLLNAIAADTQNDADIWVQSDRFALGVAICEMVVWSDEVDAILRKEGRGQLLPDDIIMKRDLSRLPKRLIDTFPDGFLLLDRALHATGPAAMPSPEDWLRVLGFDEEKEFQGRPVISVYRTRGNSRAKYGTARLLAAKGDLSKVAPQLADLAFQITDAKLEFRFPSGPMVKRRRNGRLADVTSGIRFVVANPGDTYYVGEWELEIADRVDPVQSVSSGGSGS